MNQTKNMVICKDLKIATSAWQRTKGLLGQTHLPADEALWIKPCSSIHTYFMKFTIDVAFVDKNLKVTKVATQVRPWTFVFSLWKSDSVFETSSGVLSTDRIEVGDQLHVDC